jgi:hypothetical protein
MIAILCTCVLLATAYVTITDAAYVLNRRKTNRMVHVNEAWRQARVRPTCDTNDVCVMCDDQERCTYYMTNVPF